MLEGLKRWFSPAPAPAKGWDALAPWAEAKQYGFRGVRESDGFVIDGFGPDGVSARVLDVTRNVVKIQTGYLYHYAFAMLIGVAALITWFIVRTGTS